VITDNDEKAYKEEVRDLGVWYEDNNLSLNVNKTKEMIDGAVVERVENFKILGVHIFNKLSWSKHTKTVVKRAQEQLFPLWRMKRFGMGPQILKSSTAAPSRES
jgi:hypothetical protein